MRSLATAFATDDAAETPKKSSPENALNKAAKRLAAHRWSRRQKNLLIGLLMALSLMALAAVIWADQTGRLGFWQLRTELELESALAERGLFARNINLRGQHYTTQEEVRAALGAYDREPLNRLNPADMAERLNALPWVQSAVVQRQWPQTLNIWIEEKTPLAVLHRAGQALVIDDQGELIGQDAQNLSATLANLSGRGAEQAAPELLHSLAGFPDLHNRFVGASRHSERRWNLYFSPGLEVRLGTGPIADQLAALQQLQIKDQILDKDIVALDLRNRRPLILR